MKTEVSCTLSLIPSNEAEHSRWQSLLSPYSWAEGEFGMLVTEAAFRQFQKDFACSENEEGDVLSECIRIAALLVSGNYTDVCLEHRQQQQFMPFQSQSE